MRALVLPEFGTPARIQDVAQPEPAAGELLVRVHAASINGFDLMVANGYLDGAMEHRFPVVLGKDFAGTVAAVGPDVTGFAPGDRVFGVVSKDYLGDGSFAEYVTVPAATGVAKLPDTIDFTEAAALGLASAAAIDTVDAVNPGPEQTVLVVGATGGVGNQAVQLAAAAGARVIATAGTRDERELMSELGAAEVVDPGDGLAVRVLADHPDGVDAVIHLAGDPAEVLDTVRPDGVFASLLLSPGQALPTQATVVPVFADPSTETLNRSAGNQVTGTTHVTIHRTYPLSDAPAALAAFAGGALGKLVITQD